MDKQKNIPLGKFNRSSIIGSTTVKAGIKKLGYLSKKPFLSEEKKIEEEERNDIEIAHMIFKALSSLKGTALKVAQMMSMEMELLPEAYQKELQKAASQVPPVNRALIRKIINSQFGAPPETIFKYFENIPFAAASLGQVHRAISHDGKELAVKVQYPGIASAVKSDMDMLKTILRPTRYFNMFKDVFGEIEERIAEELDYEVEASNTKWFYDNLKMDKIIVPSVYDELSTKFVLTTSRIDGLHLNEWLDTNPSQEQKNYYGQLLVDLLMTTASQTNIIHADPNIGNYLFRTDGKLGLIDFGCVKKMDQNIFKNLLLIVDAYENKDVNEILDIYNNIGICYNKNMMDEDFKEYLIEWVGWITKPMREEFFDFSINKDYFNEGLKKMKIFYKYIKNFGGSFVYLGRTEYGLYRILQKLGACVNMQLK